MSFQINNKVIGHRGACAYAPENTLAAFNQALSMGCNFIEFDVMLSADGEPFVIHDESLKRTTDGKGEVGLSDAAYLQSLDAGKWFSRRFTGERIPHLRDVLNWLVQSDINANIEIKPYPGRSEQTTVVALSYLHQFWPKNKALPLLSSFDGGVLNLCRSIAPEMPLGMLLHEWDDNGLSRATELQCVSMNLNRSILTAARVQAVKSAGFQLFSYTVNRRRQAKKLLDWGVDAVFSDYPDLLS